MGSRAARAAREWLLLLMPLDVGTLVTLTLSQILRVLRSAMPLPVYQAVFLGVRSLGISS